MDFKFSTKKAIGSIIITIVLFWIPLFFIKLQNAPAIIRSLLDTINISKIFSLGNIFIFLVEFAIVYLVWSIFQKRLVRLPR